MACEAAKDSPGFTEPEGQGVSPHPPSPCLHVSGAKPLPTPPRSVGSPCLPPTAPAPVWSPLPELAPVPPSP